MLKKLVLVIALILMAVVPNVYAQEETTITVPSGRYSLTYPSNYVATVEPVIEDFQSIFPNDSLTIADSEASLEQARDDSFDPFDNPEQEFKGLIIVSTAWAGGLLEAVGMTPETMGESLVSGASGENFEVTKTQVELQGSTGTRYLLSPPDVTSRVILQLTADSEGNIYLQIVVVGIDQVASAEAILDSLTVFDFPTETLLQPKSYDIPIEILDGELEISIPAGWWVMSAEDIVMTMPVISPEFFESLSNDDEVLQGSGAILIGYATSKSTLPDDVYNADGSLNVEGLMSLLNLGMELESDEFDKIEYTEWSSEAGLSGVSLVADMTTQRGVYMIMFVYDSGEDLSMLAGIATPDQWEQMRAVFKAISLTMRPVEAE